MGNWIRLAVLIATLAAMYGSFRSTFFQMQANISQINRKVNNVEIYLERSSKGAFADGGLPQ